MSRPESSTSPRGAPLDEGPVGLTVNGAAPRRASDGRDAFARRASLALGRPLSALGIRTVQVNVGLRCNLACRHCHVRSGPNRREEMSWETMAVVLEVARLSGASTIDVTGGAPEMNPRFRPFVEAARRQGHAVMVRTNLTIALVPGHEDLPEFFRDQRVHLIASLPCYLAVNVDRQRGRHVHAESIEVLRRLNALGFGVEEDLPLDLVYNPGGASLPPPQAALEAEYRRALLREFAVRFTRLYTLANMPIGRFQRDLERTGGGEAYQRTLEEAFNSATLEALMCRHQLHVGHDGALHDCDFNYALGLGVDSGSADPGAAPRIHDLLEPEALERFARRRVATAPHCFACTAGCGSSCGGSLL